jgi:hypothetical protein
MSDQPPQFTKGQRAASALAGTAAAMLLVVVALELLPDETARAWMGIATQALLPVPLIFWCWPDLILRLAKKSRSDSLKNKP